MLLPFLAPIVPVQGESMYKERLGPLGLCPATQHLLWGMATFCKITRVKHLSG